MSFNQIVKDFYGVIRGKIIRKEPVYIPVMYGSLLEGRSVLVTGGTSGIGYSIARACLRNGAEVVITGRDEVRISRAVETLSEERGSVHGIILDNTDVANMGNRLMEAVSLASCGYFDALVNNAGVYKGAPYLAMDEQTYDAVLDTNLKGTYFMAKEFCNYLIREKRGGNVLNIASSSSLRPAISPYHLSKWGIRAFTQGLAKSMVSHGIVVNGLAPGVTATPMLMGDDTGHLEHGGAPSGRYASPEEIANYAVILLSSLSNLVLGDVIYITGGSGNLTYDDERY